MRPVKLIISGWGPYAGEAVVDFDAFLEKGIFLITGPTGAGKTTIFDAVSFALYGDVSGKYRDKNSVRSDFAVPGTETCVSLIFEHKGKRYNIRRSPKYERAKKRGTGTVLASETAELYEGTLLAAAGTTEVNRRMEDLLGITYEQFKQISMIAQGEFMELLTASSSDRGVILRKLFQTDRYDRMARILSDKAKGLKGRIGGVMIKMEEAADRINCDAGKELKGLLSSDYRDYYRICTGIREQLVSDRKVRGELDHLITGLEEEIKQRVKVLEQEKRRGILVTRQKELEQSLSIVTEKLNGSLFKEQYKQELEEELMLRKEEEKKIEGYLPLFDKVEELIEQRTELDIKEAGLRDKIVSLNSWDSDVKVEIRKKKEELDLYKGIELSAGDNRLKMQKLSSYKAELEELSRKLEGICKKRDRLEQLKSIYQSCNEERKNINRCCEEKEEAYKNAAVGLAARYLAKGQPCPVCGSLEHPRPAVITGDVPDENELEEWKKKREQIQSRYNDAYEKAAVMNGSVIQEQEEYLRRCRMCKLPAAPDKKTIEAVLERTGLEYRTLEEEEERLKERLARKEALEQAILSLEEQRIRKDGEKQKLEEEYRDIKSGLDILEGRLENSRQQLPKEYLSRAAAKERYADVKKRIRELEEKQAAARREEDILVAQKQRVTALLIQTGEELKGEEGSGTAGTVMEIEQSIVQLEKVKKEREGEREELSIGIRENENAFRSIRKRLDEKEKLEREYGIIKDLDNAAQGNNPERAVFEHYILASYFEQILYSANIRLMNMTSGRFLLKKVEKVADGRTKGFLDLEVMDYYTGKCRSVKTLSGGEAFKAALSLALGLSDVVQNHAGGIQIDTIFIDEGFGGLDSESLDQALDALIGLTQQKRMIGIISHVSELKERIDCQVLVEKSNCGSRIHQKK